jgi:hypothetical protein
VVHGCQQVHWRGVVVAAAAQGLAVDRERLPPRRSRWWSGGRWWWLLVGQPAADGQVQGVGVDAGQHAAHGGLAGWPPDPTQRVAAHPSAASTWSGASLVHSPIAASDLAPASTAAIATASTAVSVCRRPRRWRGSAIWAR